MRNEDEVDPQWLKQRERAKARHIIVEASAEDAGIDCNVRTSQYDDVAVYEFKLSAVEAQIAVTAIAEFRRTNNG